MIVKGNESDAQKLSEIALKLNVKSIILLAAPNVLTFYQKIGFYKIDKKESSILGRFLPVLQKGLKY